MADRRTTDADLRRALVSYMLNTSGLVSRASPSERAMGSKSRRVPLRLYDPILGPDYGERHRDPTKLNFGGYRRRPYRRGYEDDAAGGPLKPYRYRPTKPQRS